MAKKASNPSLISLVGASIGCSILSYYAYMQFKKTMPDRMKNFWVTRLQ